MVWILFCDIESVGVFLLMMGIRIKVEIVNLWLEFSFGLMFHSKARSVTFVKTKS